MQTIFAIDGAEFGDLGAFSQALSRLQSWLVTLGQKTGDGTLQVLVVDGLIGPKTQTATNLAFSKYFSGVGVGTLTQSQVAARADELANYVQAGIAKAYPSTGAVIATVAAKEEPKTTAMVPYQAPAAKATTIAPTYIPAPIDTSSGLQANIIKWSAIGLGLVVATAGIYYVIRKRGVAMAGFSGDWDYDTYFAPSPGDNAAEKLSKRAWLAHSSKLHRQAAAAKRAELATERSPRRRKLLAISADQHEGLARRLEREGSRFGDFGMKGDRINDNERRLWVSNDEGLYNWYQSEARRGDGGGMKAFIKRNRVEIDAAIRRVRDRPAAQTRFYGYR